VKQYENGSTIAKVIVKTKVAYFLRPGVYLYCTSHSQTWR